VGGTPKGLPRGGDGTSLRNPSQGETSFLAEGWQSGNCPGRSLGQPRDGTGPGGLSLGRLASSRGSGRSPALRKATEGENAEPGVKQGAQVQPKKNLRVSAKREAELESGDTGSPAK